MGRVRGRDSQVDCISATVHSNRVDCEGVKGSQDGGIRRGSPHPYPLHLQIRPQCLGRDRLATPACASDIKCFFCSRHWKESRDRRVGESWQRMAEFNSAEGWSNEHLLRHRSSKLFQPCYQVTVSVKVRPSAPYSSTPTAFV